MTSSNENGDQRSQFDQSRSDTSGVMLSSIGSDSYNTVYQRIMDRMAGENGIPLVVACVAYSLYKHEKRAWIVEQQTFLGAKPSADKVDAYVSSWTNLRIESIVIQARALIQDFASHVIDSSKFEINDQIYRSQFQGLHDLIGSRDTMAVSRHESIMDHVRTRTRTRWWPGIWQSLLANLFWTFVVVMFLVSLNLGFDFNKFPNRVRAFFNPTPATGISSKPE